MSVPSTAMTYLRFNRNIMGCKENNRTYTKVTYLDLIGT